MREANEIHVNMGFAERVMGDEISEICHAPGDSQSYKTAFGSSRWNSKRTLSQWEGSYVDDRITRDEDSLVDFFSHQTNQDHYCIVDEHGTEYSIEGFLRKIEYNGAQEADMLVDTTPPAWYNDSQSVRESGFETHFRISNKADGRRESYLI